mgnify:CR=1 FL=1
MNFRAALLLAALAAGPPDRPPELHVLTWSDYFAPDTISGFEKEFGCRVTLDYIESSDTLRAKLAGGRSGYDVVFPSDEVLGELVARELYDHEADPQENENVAAVPAHAELIERLAAQLRATRPGTPTSQVPVGR